MKRNKSMDIAKAIGIILVVIGHSDSPLTSFVYLFHMPLFFFISGYFYKDEYSDKPLNLIIKRLKTLYVPFVAYEILFLLLHNIFLNINIYSNINNFGIQAVNFYNVKDFIKGFAHILFFNRVEQLAAAFWFFTTLFITNVIFCLISFYVKHVIKNNKHQEIFRTIIIIFSFTLGNVFAYFNIHTQMKVEVALVVLLFFYTGYLYKKYESIIKIKLSASIICLIALICSSFYGTLNISTNENINFVFLLYNSFIGIYFIMCVSNYIANSNNEFKLLKYIGNSTVVILCLHFLCFKIINLVQILIYKYPMYRIASFPTLSGSNGWWFVYVLTGVFVPICIKYIFNIIVKNIEFTIKKRNFITLSKS